PMIASWPAKIKAGSKSDKISVHYDMLATFTDIAGYTDTFDTDGISLLPTFLSVEKQNEHEFLYWEFPSYGGQVAMRMGDWKIVRQHLKSEEKPTIELYNLKDDPAEQQNIADEHPEILKKASEIFAKERDEPELQSFAIPLLNSGLLSE
ncbi:sulfatase/phosphatase domain-containing protein, partial [Aurantibacter sp.]|uniref:sulfatase/phosphatase domain-containing protein n=1 Tax=Aurantibacter sp. TaxID=2807103 RepID=UPI0032640E60